MPRSPLSLKPQVRTCCHHTHGISGLYLSVHYAYIYYYALVAVIYGVENKRLERCFFIALRRRNHLNNLLKHLLYIFTCFCGNARCLGTIKAYYILNLHAYRFRVGSRQIYLVYDRTNLKVMVKSKVCIGKCLCLYSLCCVHDKNSALTRRKRT